MMIHLFFVVVVVVEYILRLHCGGCEPEGEPLQLPAPTLSLVEPCEEPPYFLSVQRASEPAHEVLHLLHVARRYHGRIAGENARDGLIGGARVVWLGVEALGKRRKGGENCLHEHGAVG